MLVTVLAFASVFEYRTMPLTVSELIELLSQRPPNALVVVGDPNDGGIGRLRAQDVRDVRLRFDEANGVGWLELVDEGELGDAVGVWLRQL